METIFSRRDQLDLVLLARQFVLDPGEHRGVGIGQAAGEETVRLDVVERGLDWCSYGLLGRQFVDAMLMAAPGKGGVEEGLQAGDRHALAGQARAHRDDVGVVMFAGEARGERLVDQRAAAARARD